VPKAYCARQIPNAAPKFWDTRAYKFCFHECEKKDGKWVCPLHGENVT